MKKTTITFIILLASFAVSQASVTISGTSLFSTEIYNNSEGIYISSNTGSFDESLFTTLANGTSFANGTLIGDYTVLGSGAVNNATATQAALNAGVTFNLGGNVSTGNEIGLLVFSTSTGSATASDTYTIWTNDRFEPSAFPTQFSPCASWLRTTGWAPHNVVETMPRSCALDHRWTRSKV